MKRITNSNDSGVSKSSWAGSFHTEKDKSLAFHQHKYKVTYVSFFIWKTVNKTLLCSQNGRNLWTACTSCIYCILSYIFHSDHKIGYVTCPINHTYSYLSFFSNMCLHHVKCCMWSPRYYSAVIQKVFLTFPLSYKKFVCLVGWLVGYANIKWTWDCTSSCSIWTDQGLMWGSCL